MSLKAFFADALVTNGQVLKGLAVLAEHGKVKALLPVADIPSTAEKHDFTGRMLAPGLVDAQVNGGGGVLFNEALSVEGLTTIAQAQWQEGTVAFLPTFISDDLDKMQTALDAIQQMRQKHDAGGVILGIHLEGPFLNAQRSGCHPASHLRQPDNAFLDRLDFSGVGAVMMTVAPELFSPEQLEKLTARGVILSCGHSSADAQTLAAATASGLKGITHLFNAMGGLSARAPGLSGRALDNDLLYCGLIADGAHVAPEMIRLAVRAKPEGKLFFVSDAMPPVGQTPPQDFSFFGQRIAVRDGKCVDAEGHLFGSASSLFACVRHAVMHVGIPLEKALAMASLYPARFLGMDKDVGSLQPGCRASLIAFDSDLKLQKVIF